MTTIKPVEEGKETLTKLKNIKNQIFLTGPCPISNYDEEDWRTEAFDILEELEFSGTVITPTKKYYSKLKGNALKKQTEWEYEAMHLASAIVFLGSQE